MNSILYPNNIIRLRLFHKVTVFRFDPLLSFMHECKTESYKLRWTKGLPVTLETVVL